MKIKDSVKFRSDLFFNGSVEVDCIYDNRDLALKAANSYVFHSKNSFTESSDGKIDTIGFVNEIFNNAYSNSPDNPFITGIAGYGSGKSHFSTALAALFGNNKNFLDHQRVLENIKEIDQKTFEQITGYLKKPNIVFAINGMRNVDLTQILYTQLKDYLKISNIQIPLFTDIELVYDKAKLFVSSNFKNENFQSVLKDLLNNTEYQSVKCDESYIVEHISDDLVFSLINKVSEKLTGNRYQIENFLSPSVILEEVSLKLCGEDKPFDRVIVIFDELGRYIEWIAKKRSIDPSSMQQLYEGVKNSNGKVLFLSFIQFPISTYFNHLAPAEYTSVQRYVDRYRTAKSFHLSTILETVFANLVEIKNSSGLEDYSEFQDQLLKWNPSLNDKFIWTDPSYYRRLICDKLRVFHPLTIALLAKLSEYTQKRGPLAILKELLDNHENAQTEIVKSIVPITILHTSFKEDVLKMERSSLLKTDNVSLYDQLISKPSIESNLGPEDKSFLQSILVINLLRLKPESKSDYLNLLSHLSGLKIEELKSSEKYLEFNLGVIKYDEELFYHHIELDSVGQKDFDHFFLRKKNEISRNTDYHRPEILSEKLRSIFSDELIPFKTSLYGFVKTLEWEFPQQILDVRENIGQIVKNQIKNLSTAIYPNTSKGTMIWLYLNTELVEDTENRITEIEEMAHSIGIDEVPIQIGLILDSENILYDHVIENDVIRSLSNSERDRFGAFVRTKEAKLSIDLKSVYNCAIRDAYYLNEYKLVKSDKDYKQIVNNKVENLYRDFIPFSFDGFNKSKNHFARAEFIQIVKTFSREEVSLSTFNESLQPNTFNRFLGLVGDYHWSIFDDEELTKPKDKKVLKLFNYIDELLAGISEKNSLVYKDFFNSLLGIPYGLNIYSADLMFIYVASFHRDHLSFQVDNQHFDLRGWINYIHNSDIDLDLLKKTVIEYFDIKKQEETVNKILKKILEEDSITEILSLSENYERLINDTYLSEEIRLNLIQVNDRITKAESLKNKFLDISKMLNDLMAYRDDQRDGVPNILKKYLELIGKWPNLETDVKTDLFQMPREWIDEYNLIKTEILEFIKEQFEEWFSRNRVPVNHNIEGFVAFNKKIAKSLYEMELNRYGKAVNDNLKEIESSVNLINHINNRISEFSNTPIPTTAVSCREFRTLIDDFIKEIHLYVQLTDLQKREFENILKNRIDKINVQLSQLDDLVASIWDFLADEEVDSISSLTGFIQDLGLVLDKIDKDHSDYQFLTDIYQNASMVKEDLLEIKSSYFDIQDVVNRMQILRDKYSDNLEDDPESLNCFELFKNFEKMLIEDIELKIRSWISYIPIDRLDNCSDSELKKYYDYIQKVPTFLGEKEIERIEKIRLRIISRLDGSIEKEIINLFSKINDSSIKKKLIEELKRTLEIF